MNGMLKEGIIHLRMVPFAGFFFSSFFFSFRYHRMGRCVCVRVWAQEKEINHTAFFIYFIFCLDRE